ncbi:hypothetical protein F511_40498 [Dorcoceras hygrometricum]|uniref:Uncharacterized protein n=1 Tax=Dorcoceras hygrometricum TaxID=472368 RepID=A0A2Z7BJ38_9LAMI|nr:hypothetical protein F511_40498 [Dorcoceras hygrometricum]
MKLEYRFLHDIISKKLTTKDGSFNAVTQNRFDLMVAIMGGNKINRRKILFRILKAMVVPSIDQAQRFAVQLSLMLKGVLRLKLGESTVLPFLRILSAKYVGTNLSKDKSARAESVEEKKISGGTEKVGVTKVKRLEEVNTSVDAFVLPVVKRAHTTIGRTADSNSEDPKLSPRETKVSAPVVQTNMSRMRAQILAVPDDESLSLDTLYRTLRGKPPLLRFRQDII